MGIVFAKYIFLMFTNSGEAEHTGIKSKKIPNSLNANTPLASVGRFEFFRQARRETEREELFLKYARSRPTESGLGKIGQHLTPYALCKVKERLLICFT